MDEIESIDSNESLEEESVEDEPSVASEEEEECRVCRGPAEEGYVWMKQSSVALLRQIATPVYTCVCSWRVLVDSVMNFADAPSARFFHDSRDFTV